jgi:hypothetical protein
VASAATVTVTAASAADPTKFAAALVSLVPGSGSQSAENQARFLGLDPNTRGNWKGVYGADGYSIAAHSTQLPPYAALSFANKLDHLWADNTTDGRALQRATSPGYVASTWYNGSTFEMNLTLRDGIRHQVALYCLDWDSRGRAERIEFVDPAGTVLDSRDVSNFQSGVYLIWEVSGAVRIRFTRLAANNAVVSGIFFGTLGPNTTTARFVGLDSTTRGDWKGVYGSGGYSIAAHSTQLPTYAGLSFSNKVDYVWANDTADARALQKTTSPGYVASTWYNNSAFEITLSFNDGLPIRLPSTAWIGTPGGAHSASRSSMQRGSFWPART